MDCSANLTSDKSGKAHNSIENEQIIEGDGEEIDDDQDELDSDTGQLSGRIGCSSQAGRRSYTGQVCSLKTLIDDGVLDPGDNLLTIDYPGAKFVGDLLHDGSIRWQENGEIFSNPSSWVNHCKKLINFENKTGSAWSTIRYQGKRLDSYKLRWYRRQKKIVYNANILENYPHKSADLTSTPSSSFIKEQLFSNANLMFNMNSETNYEYGGILRLEDAEKLRERNIYEHHTLGFRNSDQDMNIMVQCTPFAVLDRIQPFTVTISTNALVLIDFHCHLTTGEVVGYLGGTWDIASHNLAILQAFPCRSRIGDKDRSAIVEEEIRQNMDARNMSVIGWYHSHPNCAPQPTVKDIESQIEYQVAMKGECDSAYIPTIGLICSPFDEWSDGLESQYQAYWVTPPPEFKPHEYGKPMHMNYSVARDSFLTQDLLLEMRLLAHFYVGGPDSVRFDDSYKSCDTKPYTIWDKLQASLTPHLPRDLQICEDQTPSQVQVQQQALSHFWAFIKGLITQ